MTETNIVQLAALKAKTSLSSEETDVVVALEAVEAAEVAFAVADNVAEEGKAITSINAAKEAVANANEALVKAQAVLVAAQAAVDAAQAVVNTKPIV